MADSATGAHAQEVGRDVEDDADARSRLSAVPAWVGWLAAIGMAGIGLVLLALTGWREPSDSFGFPGFTAPFALSFGTIGAFVLARRPGNRVGQLLLAVGLLAGFQVLYTAYATYGLIFDPGSMPLAVVAAWLLAWAWIPFVFLSGPGLLSVFPDGRFLSPRWRGLLIVGAGFAGLATVVDALRGGPIDNFSVVDNPFGVIPQSIADPILTVAFLGIILSIVAAAGSLVLRYRRVDRDRRQQLKWLAVASVIVVVAAPLGFVGSRPGQIAMLAAWSTLPIATGIAVLRYRLYEIDTVINRALVYGLLTALLAGIYTASVGLSQRVFGAVTGASSDAALVAATIVIVTVFTPLKNRIQRLVDRRFKDANDVRGTLVPFINEIDERIYPLDAELALRRFVRLVVEACDAGDGRIELVRSKDPISLEERRTEIATPEALEWSTPAGDGTLRLRLEVQQPARLTAADRTIVAEALVALGEAISAR